MNRFEKMSLPFIAFGGGMVMQDGLSAPHWLLAIIAGLIAAYGLYCVVYEIRLGVLWYREGRAAKQVTTRTSEGDS